jgi:hypothetical protein
MVYNGDIRNHMTEITNQDFICFGFMFRPSRHNMTLGRSEAFRQHGPLYDQMAYA